MECLINRIVHVRCGKISWQSVLFQLLLIFYPMLCQEGLEEEAYTDEELKRKGKRNDISCLSTVVSQYVNPIQIYVLRLHKKKFLRHILIS